MAKKEVNKSTKLAVKAKVIPRAKNSGIKESFPDILCKAMGIVTNACRNAGIERTTYYKWRSSDPEFCAACDKASEYAGDFVESKLYELINDKNPSAIIFYCKTKLSSRGYMEKKEIYTRGPEDSLREIKELDENIN